MLVSVLCQLKNVCRHTGILQRGDNVEKVETSKRRSFNWNYAEPLAICVRVDAKRKFNGVYQQVPTYKSDWPSKPSPTDFCLDDDIISSAIRCGGRRSLSSCKAHYTWRLERGKCLLQDALSRVNNLRLAQHSY